MLKSKKEKDYAFPVRLGDMKEVLRKEAYAQERSLHFWIKKILRNHVEKTQIK